MLKNEIVENQKRLSRDFSWNRAGQFRPASMGHLPVWRDRQLGLHVGLIEIEAAAWIAAIR
jgi:hypothetical protein